MSVLRDSHRGMHCACDCCLRLHI